jgi:hypothetical protein
MVFEVSLGPFGTTMLDLEVPKSMHCRTCVFQTFGSKWHGASIRCLAQQKLESNAKHPRHAQNLWVYLSAIDRWIRHRIKKAKQASDSNHWGCLCYLHQHVNASRNMGEHW